MREVVGKHEMSIDGSVLHLVARGEFTLSEIETVLAALHRIHQAHGQSFLIADLSQGVQLPAPVRKYIAAYGKQTGYSTTFSFFVGASVLTRALVQIATRTIELFSGTKSSFDFVRSVESASARIAALKTADP